MIVKRDIGSEILQGLDSAIKHVQRKKTKAIIHKVQVPEEIDVRAIRNRMHLSRVEFANRYGFSSRTVQHWEQGDRKPSRSARILLGMVQEKPKLVEKIISKFTLN